jgi:predicted dienelactone hydrolase
MRQLLIALVLAATATASGYAQTSSRPASQEAQFLPAPGFKPWRGPGTATGKPLEGALWYPAVGVGASQVMFNSKVFESPTVQTDAAVRPGRWPLVLLSHGIGGHWGSLSWLGVGLAQQGAVVVAVNHPGSTFGDFDLRRSSNHGTRVNDLKVALDVLLADPAIGPLIDPQRIYAAGFSFGGWTALSMGGLRGDLDAYARYCAQSGHRHCRDIARKRIDLRQLDASSWNRSYRDARVKAVAAIDPGLHQGLTAAQASDMVDRVLLIGLGHGANRLPDTDFSAPDATLTKILPTARTEILAPANHFSALLPCKPAGAKLLADDNDDPVCTDPPGTDRRALHRHMVQSIARHFGLTK